MTTQRHEVPQELLTRLQAGHKKPEDLNGENGLLKQRVEKALDAELTEPPGYGRQRQWQHPQRQEQEDPQGRCR